MPFYIRKLIAYGLGQGVLRYEITLFSGCSELRKAKMDRILRGILKSVAYNFNFFSEADVFDTIALPNFSSLFVRSVVLLHYWCPDFKRFYACSRNLRQSPCFSTARGLTRYGMRVRSHPSLTNFQVEV